MKNKTNARFILSIVGLLVIAVVAYFWVTNVMSSAQDYRSPLANNPPAPGEPLGAPLTRRVVVVLIDALRYDTSMNTSVMPFLNGLRTQGASAQMHSQAPSFSAPGWTTLLTGGWPAINDSQIFNPPDVNSARPFTQDNLFAAAQRAGLRTAVSGYSWFGEMLQNSGIDASFYTPQEDQTADRAVVDAALPWLTNDYQLVLIHIDQVDYAGHHQGGPRSPNWNAAATRADGLLREIVSTLDLSQDTVLVVSDHGQIDRGGHGGPEPVTLVEPFVLAGASVVPGQYGNVQMTDVAPTLSVLLGTNIPAINEGHVLSNMLTLTSKQNDAIQSALQAQQPLLFKAYTAAIGATASVGTGDIVSATQTAMDQARLARLSSERVFRNVLAVVIAILPGYYLFLRKDKKILWLAIGAVVTILIFNFRWAILDGRTYSLASVDSASWLITYSATTSAFATLFGWLVAMLGLRAFKTGARLAAEVTLGFVWFTIYLLALPILLSFAINGIVVTWTLPEFYTLFVSLLSQIQWMIVAAFGLVLAGIASLIGLVVARSRSRSKA